MAAEGGGPAQDKVKDVLKNIERLSTGSYLKRFMLLLGIGTFLMDMRW